MWWSVSIHKVTVLLSVVSTLVRVQRISFVGLASDKVHQVLGEARSLRDDSSQSYGDLLNYSDSSLEIQKIPLSSGIFYDI